MKRFVVRAIFYATVMFALPMVGMLLDPPEVTPGEMARRIAMAAGICVGGGAVISLLDLIRLRLWPNG